MSYSIPLFDLNYGDEEEKAVIKTLRSKWIAMGQNVQEVEQRFAARLGVKHAIAVSNCTAALHMAMQLLDIGVGDEVIVPSLTFVATANAVRYVSATPVFADITGHDDFSIDPADIERKITSATKAIIVMHYGGFSCEMDSIMRIARDRGIHVVEDAAHSPDAEYKAKKLGAIGDIGCFSFYSNKNITCAEGGLVVTNNDAYAERAKLLRSHGMTTVSFDRAKGHATSYDVVDLGYNYRMDDIRAALLLEQMKKLDADVSRREVLRGAYLDALGSVEGIVIPYENSSDKSSNYIFPVVLKDGDARRREEVRTRLADYGIQTSVHYPAVHRFSVYRQFASALPKTEYVADHEITLPFFPGLTDKQVEYVSDMLKKSL